MRKLYSIETPVIYKRRRYIVQTIELCVPVPVFNFTGQKAKQYSDRRLRYECLLIRISETGHPNFAKASLIERHETKDEAIRQHNRVIRDIKRGATIFGTSEAHRV